MLANNLFTVSKHWHVGIKAFAQCGVLIDIDDLEIKAVIRLKLI